MNNEEIIKKALKSQIYDLELLIKDLEGYTSIPLETKEELIFSNKKQIAEYKRVLEDL